MVFTQIRSVRRKPELSPIQEAVCEVIKTTLQAEKARDSKKTYRFFGEKTGLGYDIITNLANKDTVPTEDRVNTLREVLGKSDSWPYADAKRLLGAGQLVDAEPELELPVEIVGFAAGGPQIFNVDTERRKVLIPAKMAVHTDCAFIIDGDSMMPWLEEYDCACFKARVRPWHGRPMLIQLDGNGLMVKVTWFDRGEWFLRSFNRAHKTFRMPDGARPLGYLIGWYRKSGSRELTDLDPEGLSYEFDRPFHEDFT